jgi:hypothetical protein
LKELIDANTGLDGQQSAVIQSTMVVIGKGDTMIGKVKYIMRMRNSISKILKFNMEKEPYALDKKTDLDEIPDLRVKKRILHIKVEKASLKHSNHKSFVTYQLWNE